MWKHPNMFLELQIGVLLSFSCKVSLNLSDGSPSTNCSFSHPSPSTQLGYPALSFFFRVSLSYYVLQFQGILQNRFSVDEVGHKVTTWLYTASKQLDTLSGESWSSAGRYRNNLCAFTMVLMASAEQATPNMISSAPAISWLKDISPYLVIVASGIQSGTMGQFWRTACLLLV